MMLNTWAPLLACLGLLVALWWVSRRLAYFFVSTLYLITRSQPVAVALYAILILPGTLVHETSHWLAARLTGVRTGNVTILPKLTRQGTLQLGSVDVHGGNLWQHTVIGLAPMLVGSLLTVWLSYGLVNVNALRSALAMGQWQGLAAILDASLSHPDATLGIYLLFTVSDAMFLSASDRAPIQRMLLYLGGILALLYLVGLLPSMPSDWVTAVRNAFTVFAWGLAVALLVHATLTLLFAAATTLLSGLIRR